MNLLVLLLVCLAVLHVREAHTSKKAKKCIGAYICQKKRSSKGCVCIKKTQICDGKHDCPLLDDEMDCPCAPLPNPLNGNVDHTEGLKLGSRSKYHCNVGYKLNGGPTRMCMQNGKWAGTAPTCEDKEGCDCDNQSPIGEVKVPLDMNTDLLTLDEYKSIVVDTDYKGVWELVDTTIGGLSQNTNHFDLKVRIGDANNAVQSRRISFATTRTNPMENDCLDFTSTTMEPIKGTSLAINHMNLGGDTSNRRLNVHFSSCPDKYVWEMQCVDYTSTEILMAKTCPVKSTVVWLKVKDMDTYLDELPLEQVTRDLYVNTGIKLCQTSDIPSWFLQVGSLCKNVVPSK